MATHRISEDARFKELIRELYELGIEYGYESLPNGPAALEAQVVAVLGGTDTARPANHLYCVAGSGADTMMVLVATGAANALARAQRSRPKAFRSNDIRVNQVSAVELARAEGNGYSIHQMVEDAWSLTRRPATKLLRA